MLPNNQATSSSSPALGSSGSIDLTASTWNTTSVQSIDQLFSWQVLPFNTPGPTPSGQLALLFQSGNKLCDITITQGHECDSAAPTKILSFNGDGTINFAPGQVFPVTGTSGGTVTQINTGVGLSGGPITGSGTITNTGVLAFNGRNGNVVPATGDYNFAQIGGTVGASQLPNNGAFLPLTGGNLTGPETITVSASGFSGLFVTQSSTNATAINVHNTATGVTALSNAIYSETDSDNGVGVWGNAPSIAAGSRSIGVYGSSSGPAGTGVSGAALATTGSATGVSGSTNSATGYGVAGNNFAPSGSPAFGVFGSSASPNGTGLFGEATSAAPGSNANGVSGTTASQGGNGVLGNATDRTPGGGTNGVEGTTASENGNGVLGIANCSVTNPTPCPTDPVNSGFATGVRGVSAAPNGIGVLGVENDTSSPGGVNARITRGVQGVARGPNGRGVFGRATSTAANADTRGVVGLADSPFQAIGVLGTASAITSSISPNVLAGVFGQSGSPNGYGVFGLAYQGQNPNTGVLNTVTGTGVYGESDTVAGLPGVFNNAAQDTASPPNNLCVGNSACKLLVAQANGTNELTIRGDGSVHANGTYSSAGADFAESVSVAGQRRYYEAGDVLIIDGSGNRRLAKSQEAYSTLVAGIVSTKPGMLASLHNTNDAEGEKQLASEVPLAVVGIVPCKVSAENGSIHRGDLLVASSTPGYAMKGTDRGRMLGAVVGKAMQPLESGKGTIEVLVTLQ